MLVPTPPSDDEKTRYHGTNRFWFYGLGTLSFVFLTAGMIVFLIQRPIFWFYFPFVCLIMFYLVISYVIGIFGKEFDYKRHKVFRERHKDYFPTVDVFLPNCGEHIDVLRNAMVNVAKLDWPNLHIYCLDDKGRPEVEALAKGLGFHYLSRPNKGVLKKAGNLRHGFARSEGEFILILDADFTPRPDMLRELIPYFKDDPTRAIVQTPQFFEITPGQTWVQKGAAYIQELFYRLIQVSRNRWGAAICVGTCAVYRRAALEPFGGTAAIEHSEDVHTGFYCIEAGWKLEYVSLNLAKGLCPDDLKSFFTQQYRWATGSFTLFTSRRFWDAKLGFMRRVCYLSGMLYYLASGVEIFMTPLPSIIIVWCYPDKIYWYNLMFSVPSFLFGIIYVGIWTTAPFGWYGIAVRKMSYWAHTFAIYDKAVKGKSMAWVTTGEKDATGEVIISSKGKKNPASKKYRQFLWFYHTWHTVVFGIIMLGVVVHIKRWDNYHFYPLIFFNAVYYVIDILWCMDLFKNKAKAKVPNLTAQFKIHLRKFSDYIQS